VEVLELLYQVLQGHLVVVLLLEPVQHQVLLEQLFQEVLVHQVVVEMELVELQEQVLLEPLVPQDQVEQLYQVHLELQLPVVLLEVVELLLLHYQV
jgi:hypothetical protein